MENEKDIFSFIECPEDITLDIKNVIRKMMEIEIKARLPNRSTLLRELAKIILNKTPESDQRIEQIVDILTQDRRNAIRAYKKEHPESDIDEEELMQDPIKTNTEDQAVTASKNPKAIFQGNLARAFLTVYNDYFKKHGMLWLKLQNIMPALLRYNITDVRNSIQGNDQIKEHYIRTVMDVMRIIFQTINIPMNNGLNIVIDITRDQIKQTKPELFEGIDDNTFDEGYFVPLVLELLLQKYEVRFDKGVLSIKLTSSIGK